jgi:hypothetical protein
MNHAERFARLAYGFPRWIGVRQLAVQRVWALGFLEMGGARNQILNGLWGEKLGFPRRTYRSSQVELHPCLFE